MSSLPTQGVVAHREKATYAWKLTQIWSIIFSQCTGCKSMHCTARPVFIIVKTHITCLCLAIVVASWIHEKSSAHTHMHGHHWTSTDQHSLNQQASNRASCLASRAFSQSWKTRLTTKWTCAHEKFMALPESLLVKVTIIHTPPKTIFTLYNRSCMCQNWLRWVMEQTGCAYTHSHTQTMHNVTRVCVRMCVQVWLRDSKGRLCVCDVCDERTMHFCLGDFFCDDLPPHVPWKAQATHKQH
jgi:hypothetical protein